MVRIVAKKGVVSVEVPQYIVKVGEGGFSLFSIKYTLAVRAMID